MGGAPVLEIDSDSYLLSMIKDKVKRPLLFPTGRAMIL
jgi:hypothetical protein